jgi:hypothetical protein
MYVFSIHISVVRLWLINYQHRQYLEVSIHKQTSKRAEENFFLTNHKKAMKI